MDSTYFTASAAGSSSATQLAETGAPTSGTFNPAATGAFQCNSYVTLQPSSATGQLDVPARDAAGTCYVIKLISESSFSPSSLNPQVDRHKQ